MDLLQLYYFRELARDGSVTRTAERLSISQPALSKTLRNLEQELGLPLFDRIGRTIELNADGKYFFEAVDRALNVLNEATNNLQSRSRQEASAVTLINLIPEYYSWFLDAFLSVTKDIPLREIFLETNMEDALYSGNVDVVLSYQGSMRCDFVSETLLEDELLLLVPTEYPGFTAPTVTVDQFCHETIISFYHDLGIPAGITSMINKPTYQVSDLMMLVHLVEQQYGVAVIPSYIWLQLQPKLRPLHEKVCITKVIPIQARASAHRVMITYSNVRHISRNCKFFIQFAKEYFTQEQMRLEQFRRNGYFVSPGP